MGFQLTARRRSDPSQPAGTFDAAGSNFVAVRCADGRFAPCNAGESQYVTHTSVGTNAEDLRTVKSMASLGTRRRRMSGRSTLLWLRWRRTNDRGTNGDVTAVDTTSSLYAPANSPAIRTGTGVLHAGALSRSPQSVAPKQLLSIFGTNLNAPGAFIEAGIGDFDVDGRLPTELGKLSVEFTTPGQPTPGLGA